MSGCPIANVKSKLATWWAFLLALTFALEWLLSDLKFERTEVKYLLMKACHSDMVSVF